MLASLNVLKSLYFPELDNEVYHFTRLCGQQSVLIIKLGSVINKIGRDQDPTAQQARQSAHDSFKSEFLQIYPEFLASRRLLTTAARSLLERIMNVEEQTPSDAQAGRSEA